MKRFLKDPLLHFLLAGVVIFAVVAALTPAVMDDKTIVIDRPSLLTFIQYRLQSFDEDRAARRLDGLTDKELEALIKDYVQEEALFREAKALGLEQSDYVIRRRLVQKLEFMAEGIAGTGVDVTEKQLRDYYTANPAMFSEPDAVTFTHVFLSALKDDYSDRDAEANTLLMMLNGAQVPFEGAAQYGERFLYGLNFVERSQDDIADLFGADTAARLFHTPVTPAIWQGPFRSPHGVHLILLVDRKEGGLQPFETVQSEVLARWQQDQISERRQAILDDTVSRYTVQIEDLGSVVRAPETTP